MDADDPELDKAPCHRLADVARANEVAVSELIAMWLAGAFALYVPRRCAGEWTPTDEAPDHARALHGYAEVDRHDSEAGKLIASDAAYLGTVEWYPDNGSDSEIRVMRTRQAVKRRELIVRESFGWPVSEVGGVVEAGLKLPDGRARMPEGATRLVQWAPSLPAEQDAPTRPIEQEDRKAKSQRERAAKKRAEHDRWMVLADKCNGSPLIQKPANMRALANKVVALADTEGAPIGPAPKRVGEVLLLLISARMRNVK